MSATVARKKSGRPSAGFIPTRSLALPSRPYRGSGQARVSSGNSGTLRGCRYHLQMRRLVLQSLGTFAAQGTSALIATHRRDCGRRSCPQTRSTSRKIGLPLAPVCSRPAPCSRTLRGKRSRPTACCLPLARHSGPWRSLHFSLAPANRQSAVQVLSLPASQGRCNKRPGSVFPPHHGRCQESAS